MRAGLLAAAAPQSALIGGETRRGPRVASLAGSLRRGPVPGLPPAAGALLIELPARAGACWILKTGETVPTNVPVLSKVRCAHTSVVDSTTSGQ